MNLYKLYTLILFHILVFVTKKERSLPVLNELTIITLKDLRIVHFFSPLNMFKIPFNNKIFESI